MNRWLLLLLVCCTAGPLSAADKETDAEALAKKVAPYIDDQALVVVHADLARLDFDAVFTLLQKIGAAEKELAVAKLGAKAFLEQLRKTGLKEGFLVVSLADVPEQLPLMVLPLPEGADDKALTILLKGLDRDKSLKFEKVDGALLAGSERAIKRVSAEKPVRRPELTRAFNAAGNSAVRAAVFANQTLRKAIEELEPKLPAEIGGGSSTILTRGLRWGAVGISLAPDVSLTLTLQGSDEAAAKALQGLFTSLFKTIGREKGVREVWPDFEKVAAAFTPKLQDDRLTLVVKQEQFTAVLGPGVRRAREAASLAVEMNNLKQIGLAFHSYHDTYRVFPASASYDKKGKALLSWHVHLLPYLGQEELYKEFRLDETWDSPHNKKLIKKMPRVYLSPSLPALAEEGKTTYVVPAGQGTAFAGKEGLPIGKVTDGLANTILGVELDADTAVIWTKPVDLQVNLKEPARGLRRHANKGFLVLLMDGSVRILPASIKAATLAAYITPDGGEAIEEP